MEKKILYPVDTANFRNIRGRGLVYVDKTGYIQTLTERGTYYFLARPRRFGKSLFLDTLAEYFKGNRELFKGLEIGIGFSTETHNILSYLIRSKE